MKKTFLSASIAAILGGLGFVGVASANVVPNAGATGATNLIVDDTGTGHMLFVPYFTTQGTNATLLNITNTDTSAGKVVKVRFRGASNSDDLFDFTLLLSPGDMWSAKLSQGADGITVLETADKSCTLPAAVATTAQKFSTARVNPALTGAALAAETREGYIEILSMADIPKFANADQALASGNVLITGLSNNPLWTAAKHVSGVAPCTTSSLAVLATDEAAAATAGQGKYSDTSSAATAAVTAQGKGLDYATGNIFANWTIIDTVKTATYSGEAVAVRARTAAGGNAAANILFWPQLATAVSASDATLWTADPLFRAGSFGISSGATTWTAQATPALTAALYDFPDMSTPQAATGAPVDQARGLSQSLAAKSVINEFLTTTSIAATTDWVFSMPTRRYNVAMWYGYSNPLGGDGRRFTDYSAANAGTATLTNDNYFTRANTSVVNGQICVAGTSLTQYDREETVNSSSFVVSPASPTVVRFCGETSVLAINNGTATTSGSLSASVAVQNLNFAANEGWLTVTTNGVRNAVSGTSGSYDWNTSSTSSTVGTANLGLPVIGAAFAKSSAFGAVWNHRYTR